MSVTALEMGKYFTCFLQEEAFISYREARLICRADNVEEGKNVYTVFFPKGTIVFYTQLRQEFALVFKTPSGAYFFLADATDRRPIRTLVPTSQDFLELFVGGALPVEFRRN